QYAAVIPTFFQATLDGRSAVVFGDGRQTRDFTYVDNVVEANVLAASAAADRVNGWVVNVGAGARTALLEVIGMISAITGRRLAHVHQQPRAGDVRDSLACLERAERVLGIDPRLPGPLQLLQRVRYLRTVVTSLQYVWDLLVSLARCDIVHVFSASYFSFILAPTPAVLLGRWFGKRVLLNYRSGEAEDHLRRWRRTAIPIMRLVDALVVPSGYLVDVFARVGLRARAIANVVDFDQFRFRERRPLRPVFLSNRNFEAHYNVACVLRAFARIQRRYPDARLLVAGDGKERGALERLAHQLNLRNAEFLGRVRPDRMPSLYDAADVY